MKDTQKLLNLTAAALALLLLVIVIWGVAGGKTSSPIQIRDDIEQVNLDSVHLQGSDVDIDFADVILSSHDETRKLIVSTLKATVTTKLTDRLINLLDFDFMKKTQDVSYTGTGYFVVDLDALTAANIIENKDNHTVTIRIDHAYLQAVEINPNDIMIDAVKEGLLARGEIKLTVADYNTIEKDLRTQLTEKFNTAANGQAADDLALKMVQDVYEPIIKAIDRRYSVIVTFK